MPPCLGHEGRVLSCLTYLEHLPMLLWPPAWSPPGLLPLQFSPFKGPKDFLLHFLKTLFFDHFLDSVSGPRFGAKWPSQGTPRSTKTDTH